MIGFLIFSLCSLIFFVIGISTYCSKKAAGFWANAKTPEIKDIRNYNHAVARIWWLFAVMIFLLGIPMLAGQNSAWGIVSVLGSLPAVIIIMILYTRVEQKYRSDIKK